MRQQWFSVGIFLPGLFFGLTGIENRRSQIARNPPLRLAAERYASCQVRHTSVKFTLEYCMSVKNHLIFPCLFD
jgi:hypothetical protein